MMPYALVTSAGRLPPPTPGNPRVRERKSSDVRAGICDGLRATAETGRGHEGHKRISQGAPLPSHHIHMSSGLLLIAYSVRIQLCACGSAALFVMGGTIFEKNHPVEVHIDQPSSSSPPGHNPSDIRHKSSPTGSAGKMVRRSTVGYHRSFHVPFSGNNEVPGCGYCRERCCCRACGSICYCLAGCLRVFLFLSQLFWISRAELLRVGSTAFKKSNFCFDGCLSAHPLALPAMTDSARACRCGTRLLFYWNMLF